MCMDFHLIMTYLMLTGCAISSREMAHHQNPAIKIFQKERIMKISKVLRILAALAVLSTVLAACKKGPEPTPTKKVYTYKDMTVGFIQTGSEGGWRAANTASFKETATQLGINLKFYDAQK